MSRRQELLASIGKLRATLLVLEASAGLGELSEVERIILTAAALAAGSGQTFTLEELEQQEILSEMPVSTMFRNLRALVDKGLLAKSGRPKHIIYTIQV